MVLAMPVGRVGRRGPATTASSDSWLIEIMERRSSVLTVPAPTATARKPRRASAVRLADHDNPLGPCPKVKRNARPLPRGTGALCLDSEFGEFGQFGEIPARSPASAGVAGLCPAG